MANRSNETNTKPKNINTQDTAATVKGVPEEVVNENESTGEGTAEAVQVDTEEVGVLEPQVEQEEPSVEVPDEATPVTLASEPVPSTPLKPPVETPDEDHRIDSTDVYVFTGNVKRANNIDKKLTRKKIAFTRTDDGRLKIITSTNKKVINGVIKNLSCKGFKVRLEKTAK